MSTYNWTGTERNSWWVWGKVGCLQHHWGHEWKAYPHNLGTCPQNCGSHHFNYKSYNHIILFALVDMYYKFIHIDAGTNNWIGNAGVFAKSALRWCLINRTILKVPNNSKLPNTSISVSYIVLADDAFHWAAMVWSPTL